MQQQQQPNGGSADAPPPPPPRPLPDNADPEAAAEDDEQAEGAGFDSSSDEEYNQRNFGIFQALPVEGEPDWSLTEPDSAEEYLRRVRYEAARCPQVVRVEPSDSQLSASSSAAVAGGAAAAAPSALLPQPQAIADAPAWAKPDRRWVQAFVADFQALRLQMQDAFDQQAYPTDRVPHVRDEEGWDRACFGSSSSSSSSSGGGEAAGDDAAEMTQLSPAICRKLMALQQPDVVALFLRHAQQLEDACPDGLPLRRAQWLFALAARLEKPCHAEVGAAFRGLLRHCCRLRAGVAGPADPLLPKLNVFIVMAGAYFGQDEHLCSIVDACDLA